MPATYVKTGGTWTLVTQGAGAKNAGSWSSFKGIFVRDGGTWKQTFDGGSGSV